MATKKSTYLLLWLTLAVMVIILDQWTKALATAHLQYTQPVAVIPHLNWYLVHNHGAAFSFLSDAGGWQRWFFTIIATLASATIIYFLSKHYAEKWFSFALAMILGGAIGNVIDRIRFGYVVDFIDVYYKNSHWPAFNLADSAITLGVTMLVIEEIRRILRKGST